MKFSLTISLLICLCLNGVHICVHASESQGAAFSFNAGDTLKTKAVERTGDNNLSLDTHHANPASDNDPVLLEEEEDEETFCRRSRLPIEYFPASVYAIAAHHSSTNLTHQLSVCRHQYFTNSCKYISQRTLRI